MPEKNDTNEKDKRPDISATSLYNAAVELTLDQDLAQRKISQNTKGIAFIPELAFVYEYEKKLNQIVAKLGVSRFSSFREASTSYTGQIDLVGFLQDRQILFEFKMEKGISHVAGDAIKLMPDVKSGDQAYLINIKAENTNDLENVTKRRTSMLNNQIQERGVTDISAVEVVDYFEFLSTPASDGKLASVICMWKIAF